MEKQIIKSNELEWMPLVEKDVKTDGVYVKVLRSMKTQKDHQQFY